MLEFSTKTVGIREGYRFSISPSRAYQGITDGVVEVTKLTTIGEVPDMDENIIELIANNSSSKIEDDTIVVFNYVQIEGRDVKGDYTFALPMAVFTEHISTW